MHLFFPLTRNFLFNQSLCRLKSTLCGVSEEGSEISPSGGTICLHLVVLNRNILLPNQNVNGRRELSTTFRVALSKVEMSALAVPVAVCLLYFPCWATQISKLHAPLKNESLGRNHNWAEIKIRSK